MPDFKMPDTIWMKEEKSRKWNHLPLINFTSSVSNEMKLPAVRKIIKFFSFLSSRRQKSSIAFSFFTSNSEKKEMKKQ